MLKSLLELLKEVIPGSEGYGGISDGILLEGVSPGQSGPFSHIQKGKSNFLCVSVVGGLVDHEIELDGVHPGDHCFIGAIEGFGFAKLEFDGFDYRQHRSRDRWSGVGQYDGY